MYRFDVHNAWVGGDLLFLQNIFIFVGKDCKRNFFFILKTKFKSNFLKFIKT